MPILEATKFPEKPKISSARSSARRCVPSAYRPCKERISVIQNGFVFGGLGQRESWTGVNVIVPVKVAPVCDIACQPTMRRGLQVMGVAKGEFSTNGGLEFSSGTQSGFSIEACQCLQDVVQGRYNLENQMW